MHQQSQDDADIAEQLSQIVEISARLRELGFRMLAKFQPYHQSQLSRPRPTPQQLFLHWFVHILHTPPEPIAKPIFGIKPPADQPRVDLVTRYYVTDLRAFLPHYLASCPPAMSRPQWRNLLIDICQSGVYPPLNEAMDGPDLSAERIEFPQPTLYHVLLQLAHEWRALRDLARPLSANARFLQRAVGERGAQRLFEALS